MTPEPGSPKRAPAAQDAVWTRVPQDAFEIVDAHAHLGRDAVMFMPVTETRRLVPLMDRCGVAMAVASSLLAIRQDVREGNDETAKEVDSAPGRYLGAMVLNPWHDPGGELARWADDDRMAMIKVHPDVHEYPLDGPRFDPLWRFAEDTGCPVLTHTWHGSPFNGWEQVQQVCERYPGVHLLAGHSGVSPRALDLAITLARRHPRLYLELSGSMSHGRYVERLVREVGSGQVIYGSDFPFIEMRSALGRVLFAQLNDDDLAAILGGTTTRLIAWRGR